MRADVRSRIKAFVRGGARTAPLAVACTTRARILGRETLIAPTARRTGCVPETSIQGLVPGRVAPRGELERAALRRPRGARLIGHALLARHIPHALVLKAEGMALRLTRVSMANIDRSACSGERGQQNQHRHGLQTQHQARESLDLSHPGGRIQKHACMSWRALERSGDARSRHACSHDMDCRL